MAQVVVIAVEEVPALGKATPARVYRGDHANAAEAIDAAILELGVNSTTKMWAAQASSFNRVHVDVARTITKTDE